MSRMALNIAHFKKGAVGSLGAHNWYKRGEHDTHSNQDIDTSRSKNNIALVLPEEASFYREVKNTVEQSTGRVTAASVWVSEWVLYPPEELQDPLTADKEELQRFYSDALDWMREHGYLIKLAAIHLDETTVHAHIDTVPITKDGRLSRKDVYTRATLNDIHTDLAKHLEARGWNIQRGESTKDKQVRSQTVPEYKRQAEEQKLQLVNEIEQMKEVRVCLQKDIDEAQEWLSQIPDWPTYEAEANKAFNIIDAFKNLMREVFSSGWVFRNRKGENGLLEAVESLRDKIMSVLSALRGFEANMRIPEEQQRSKVIGKSLEDMLEEASTKVKGTSEPKRLKGKDELDR